MKTIVGATRERRTLPRLDEVRSLSTISLKIKVKQIRMPMIPQYMMKITNSLHDKLQQWFM